MVNDGINPETGRPISRILKPNGYFETYNEAYAALVEYNKSPYDLDLTKITLYDVFMEWKEEYFKSISLSSIQTHMSSWNWCDELKGVPIRNIKARHIRKCLDDCTKESMKMKVKNLLCLVFDYAVENEYVDKNYARDLKYKIDEKVQNEHKAFTEEEMNTLWKAVLHERYIDTILIQCYTGFRPQELGNIKIEDVDLESGFIRGGMKTEAGKNRLVPIHEKIKGLVRMKYRVAKSIGSDYLINYPKKDDQNDTKMTYNRYSWFFSEAMKSVGFEGHRAHDPRKTFVTMAAKYNVDRYAIKMIVGHAITDVTEKVYTERDPEWLKEEINKIEKGKIREIDSTAVYE